MSSHRAMRLSRLNLARIRATPESPSEYAHGPCNLRDTKKGTP